MTTRFIGVIDGMRTWEVRDESGALVGLNQTPVEVDEIPASISARQIRLWLIRNGVSLAEVKAAIDSIPDPLQRDSVLVEWEYAPYVERSHPMLIPLAAALGLTPEQVDEAFRDAAVL